MRRKICYNKLVRDHIPDIIAGQGKPCGIRLMTDAEYLNALNANCGGVIMSRNSLAEDLEKYLTAKLPPISDTDKIMEIAEYISYRVNRHIESEMREQLREYYQIIRKNDREIYSLHKRLRDRETGKDCADAIAAFLEARKENKRLAQELEAVKRELDRCREGKE